VAEDCAQKAEKWRPCQTTIISPMHRESHMASLSHLLTRCCQALAVMSTEPAEEPHCDVAKSIMSATLDTAPGGPSSPRGALRTPGGAGRCG
jgi:hypothetical protein